MIKPWQKAALSIFVSSGLYAGFLGHLTSQTKSSNIQKHDLQVESDKQQQLLSLIDSERQKSEELKSQLKNIQNHTSQLQSEIKKTSDEIQKIKAGELAQPVQIASVPNLQQTAAQPVRKSASQPRVQAVSRASG